MIEINFLGDSITEGAGSSSEEKRYVSLVGKKTGVLARNYGKGGARIAFQTNAAGDLYDEYNFLKRAKTMENADFVYIFGGTNDYGHGDAKMGKYGDTDPYTFHGAVATLLDEVGGRFGFGNIAFIIPIPRYNETSLYGEGNRREPGYPLEEYRKAILMETKARGIETLDLSSYFGEPTTGAPSDKFQDGLHPNDKGHEIIAEVIAKDLVKRFPCLTTNKE